MAVFLTLGAGLLINSRLFLQTYGFRKFSRLSSYAAENGLKEAWSRMQVLAARQFYEPEIEVETWLAIKEAPEKVLLPVLQPLLEVASFKSQDEFSGLTWEAAASSTLLELYSDESCLKATFGFNIEATGRVQGQVGSKSERVKAELILLAGHLPLNQVPAVVGKEGLEPAASTRIKIRPLLPGSLSFAQIKMLSEKFIPGEALPLLARGLKILKPSSFPNWLLRQALGLENSNEPIPEGVYLVQDSLGPGGIYVQGDLDRLVLGIDRGFQIIQFRQKESRWLLRFNPATSRASFLSPSGNQNFDDLPIPLIMVNGKVLSLTSGCPGSDGFLEEIQEEGCPAFLSGLKITIVCSGRLDIASNLYSDGLEWKEGLPYLKSQQSQLIIWSTGQDFQSGELTDGGINLVSSPDEKRIIEASLVARGQGLKSDQTVEKLTLIGSLAATAISPGRTEINIFNLPASGPSSPSEPELQVYSERPLLHLSHLRILEWRSTR
ncbi:MAG: hypothetical protein ACUVRL_00020 [Candidatus Saccharicenans sp.]|uniref:hypothetical protein n=1 Tax=Candidatus Saccharicenans sp. TaxID=2819258 RepID=UPI00404AD1CB